ncbi:hypothetical protein SCLCIDRAFT_21053 [Scleroderma citrinum Foug A]|uniref:Uncharacterized protein n=1 Tax=Scleroderma citrinum Foug A TaxID=1036808 RepID=A0A0C3ARG3_9AGAM|nr:hypothetical protein SCLCIDRAFT_21053 [Scleroderma citrinum Foug A]
MFEMGSVPCSNKIDNLCRWYGNELAAIELALRTPENEIFYFALCEHHHDMLSLCSCWSNPLALISRFDSQIREASVLAESLSGDHPCISLFWLNPTTVEAPEESPKEEIVNLNSITGSQEAPCEPEHAVLADFLADDHGCHEDAIEDQPTVTAAIIWEPPENMSLDTIRPLLPSQHLVVPSKEALRQRCEVDGFCHLLFDPEDVVILANPTSCLNDVCINGCIALLFSSIKPPNSQHFAVFSMYDLLRICYNASDESLWNISKTVIFTQTLQ